MKLAFLLQRLFVQKPGALCLIPPVHFLFDRDDRPNAKKQATKNKGGCERRKEDFGKDTECDCPQYATNTQA
ncbi:hypothetical protein [Falsiphaeobacter marinintestinus]|uniref:hypothetical protein n=1 Tax=Falsiphaeobacter marinintestinus TaxID=1492905 RepID=UPI0011B3BA52|nr:hypothetical protein [Phaeobacter marinintestinus]